MSENRRRLGGDFFDSHRISTAQTEAENRQQTAVGGETEDGKAAFISVTSETFHTISIAGSSIM